MIKKALILSLLGVLCSLFIVGHEGHHTKSEETEDHRTLQTQPAKEVTGKLHWSGRIHFLLLHFPIALMTMSAVSELLFASFSKPLFDYASRFMLISASILAVPTALFGLIYSYLSSYNSFLETLLYWHMWCGIATALFASYVTFLREYKGVSLHYYFALFFLFLLVSMTALLGGRITFG